MSESDNQIAELKLAYEVLGVPLSASRSSIKRAYRNLVKRWHPDLYPDKTQENADATQMTKLINEAYSAIKSAPLRYYGEACPPTYAGHREAAPPSPDERRSSRAGTLPRKDRIEFWVRFVCGGLFGAFLSVRLILFYDDRLDILIWGTVSVILICGFSAAHFGDRFWHSRLWRWWMWW